MGKCSRHAYDYKDQVVYTMMKLRPLPCRPVVRHLPSESPLVLSARETYSYLANDKSSHPVHIHVAQIHILPALLV